MMCEIYYRVGELLNDSPSPIWHRDPNGFVIEGFRNSVHYNIYVSLLCFIRVCIRCIGYIYIWCKSVKKYIYFLIKTHLPQYWICLSTKWISIMVCKKLKWFSIKNIHFEIFMSFSKSCDDIAIAIVAYWRSQARSFYSSVF